MKWLVPLLFTGCVGATTLNGARPIDPGHTTLQVGGSNGTGAVQLRHGLSPDVDMGVTGRNAAIGADLRYRFVRTGRFHLATAPGLAFNLGGLGFGVGDIGFVAAGSVDVTLPLIAELQLTRTLSLVLAPRVELRNHFFWANKAGTFYQEDASWTPIVLATGTRLDWHHKRYGLGLSADIEHSPTAARDLRALIGLDLRMDLPSLTRRAKRRVRQVAREERR